MNTPSNAGKEHNPDGLTPEQVGEGWRALELENQSLTRRLEEAEKQFKEDQKLIGRIKNERQEKIAEAFYAEQKLTALRTAAEAALDALEKATARLRPIYDYLSFHASVLASEVSDVREQFDTTIEALRAELDQADSNASNSPTASRDIQG